MNESWKVAVRQVEHASLSAEDAVVDSESVSVERGRTGSQDV